MDEQIQEKRRVAVLGGGLGSLTAAYVLSGRGYDVSLYTLGWRLGGQGASGRNAEARQRIEEHGLHIWFGFYHNAFRMMREVYDALGRPSDHPLARVEEAFVGQDAHLFLEYIDGQCRPWPLRFGHDDGFPGTGDADLPDLHELLERLLNDARDHAGTRLAARLAPAAGDDLPAVAAPSSWWRSLAADVTALEHHVVALGSAVALEAAADLAAMLRHDPTVSPHLLQVVDAVAAQVRRAMLAPADDEMRRDFILLDLAVTYARGFIADDVLRAGLQPLDRFEFREWLARHGAHEMTVRSAIVQAFYDASFSYEDGRADQPNVAAGVAIRSTLRIVYGYRGHILFKMTAGMGDTIAAPIYQVLRARGVKFHFFHRVTALEPGAIPGAEARGIARVRLGRQVTLKHELYEPLVTVDGLPCWPSAPLVDQIVEGDALAGVNLESHWSGWTDVEQVTLEAGRDFDHLVLGISLGALPPICASLCAEGEPAAEGWSALFARVKTIRTQAVQLWTRPGAASCGWGPAGGITACCAEPDASWADFSHLLAREAWLPSDGIGGLFYGCGPMPDSAPAIPPATDTGFPARALADITVTADRFVTASAQPVWPAVCRDGGLDGNVVAARYLRANIDPSERYVLAVKDGEFAKLAPDESGYANLWLTGAWVKNGLDISSVEGTVMAGLACAAALSGEPVAIIGQGDF